MIRTCIRSIFILSAILLFVAGITHIVDLSTSNGSIALAIIGGLMIGDALIYAVLAFIFTQLTQVLFRIELSFVVINIFLTVVDDVGLVDILFIVLNIALFLFLIFDRKDTADKAKSELPQQPASL